MAAVLIVIDGPNKGDRIAITGSQFIIGRERDCHLRSPSEMVSRHHCVLRQDDYTLRVLDLGSLNGTYVNGRRIQGEVILGHGDWLNIGDVGFEVNLSDSASESPQHEDKPQTEQADLSTSIIDGDTVFRSDAAPDTEEDEHVTVNPPVQQPPAENASLPGEADDPEHGRTS